MRRSWRLLVALGSAWTVASVAGLMLPLVAVFTGLATPFSLSQPVILPGDLALEPPPSAVSAVLVAFFQYLVLSLLIRRVSWMALMWIPVSVIAAVGANAAGATFWSSDRAIRNIGLLQLVFSGRWFPLLAVLLGVAQGILLAQLFDRKPAIWVWGSASLLVAIIYVPLTGLLHYDSATAAVRSELAFAGIYGIVTAAALLVVISKARWPTQDQYPWKLDARSANT